MSRVIVYSACLLFSWRACIASDVQQPTINVRRGLQMPEDPLHEVLGTRNQAMGVWQVGARDPSNELVVALTHRFNEINRRADDEEFIVAWESDGETLTEVQRIPTSCPNVELTVPGMGPYVFESRLDISGSTLHPECSCMPSATHVCPRGVQSIAAGGEPYTLQSPSTTHFVLARNEWTETVGDAVTLPQLVHNVDLPVYPVDQPLLNASTSIPLNASLACPGTYDQWLGTDSVTKNALRSAGIRLPSGHVSGGWCLVHRGGCSDTAKVKVCEESGALGTIIIDHGHMDEDGDQNILVQYNREANEIGVRPVLFVNKTEGEALLLQARTTGVRVKVGPSVGGHAPPGYKPGSGLIVHAIGSQAPLSGPVTRHWPDLFDTAGWIEAGNLRNLLYVCISSLGEVRIYETSYPLNLIPLLGTISVPCSKFGYHDYHIVEYFGDDGRYKTIIIDPDDEGNRLYFYDTEDPRDPQYVDTFQVAWESDEDGLGQVRPIPPDFRRQAVTWHCSHLYCGENRGKKIHIFDAYHREQTPVEIPLPMLSGGGFARDVACTSESLCMASLTWDGVVAFDGGMKGSVNAYKIIAQHIGDTSTFSGADIPAFMAHMRFNSGAQKVYASKRFGRKFYVEHGDLELRPLRQGDYISALLLNELFILSVDNYTESEVAVDLSFRDTTTRTPSTSGTPHNPSVHLGEDVQEKDSDKKHQRHVLLVFVTLALAVLAVVLIAASAFFCVAAWRVNKSQHAEIQRLLLEMHADNAASCGSPSVVVGRPVGALQDRDAEQGVISCALSATMSATPSIVSAPAKSKAQIYPVPTSPLALTSRTLAMATGSAAGSGSSPSQHASQQDVDHASVPSPSITSVASRAASPQSSRLGGTLGSRGLLGLDLT